MTKLPNAITVDVEDYFQVSAFKDRIDPLDWHGYESRVEHNTQRLLALFDRHQVQGTFFVLGWVAEQNPGLVRQIHAAGHEVASHGFSHQLVYQQTQDVFRSETERSKKLLEDTIGEAVAGYRAASYSIIRDSLWALDVLAECGFLYDSSIFPVKHDRYGLMGGPSTPHELTLRSGASIVEYPMSQVTMGPVHIPVSGGGYFRIYPYAVTRTLLRRFVAANNAPFVFYLHPWEIDAEQPRMDGSRLSRFRHYHNLERCEDRLNQLLDDFAFAPMNRVLEEYAGRSAQVLPQFCYV